MRRMKPKHRALGHLLVHSLVRLHRSLDRLLRTARFAYAPCYAHPHCALSLRALLRSFIRSLAHSLALEHMRNKYKRRYIFYELISVDFIQFQSTVERSLALYPTFLPFRGFFSLLILLHSGFPVDSFYSPFIRLHFSLLDFRFIIHNRGQREEDKQL